MHAAHVVMHIAEAIDVRMPQQNASSTNTSFGKDTDLSTGLPQVRLTLKILEYKYQNYVSQNIIVDLL